MEPFSKVIYLQPQWVQPKTMKNRFELRVGEQIYATLEFPKTFGSLAAAWSSEGHWTFKRVGFFKPKVTVRTEASEVDQGVYTPNWMGTEGTVQFADGSCYLWKPANFWATQYAWQGEDGKELVLFKPGVEDSHFGDLFKTQARVEIQPEAQGLNKLPLLVLLGWYLMVLKTQDDASSTAATTAVVS